VHLLFLAVQVGTGKTSLVRQYVHKTFSNNYKSTIGEIRTIDIAAHSGSVRAANTGGAAQVWTLR
jgi:GTPase SAR1 family protein